MKRRAKIVATLGPSSCELGQIESLIWAGMNVARLNFSHGTHDSHAEVYATIRHAAEKLGRPISILQDLPGPKIRCGAVPEGLVLKEGQHFVIEVGEGAGDEERVFTTFESLTRDVRPGEKILIDDGKLQLRVQEVDGRAVHCTVMYGGELKSHKGIHLPESKLSIPSFTENDHRHLKFGLDLGVDLVALSFVRSKRDVLRLKRAMESHGRIVPVIAKIEKPEAIRNLDDLLETADGVMVARGDLAVEVSTEEVPILQKRVIEAANRRGKVVITATQMLESMIESPTPTRAEASDVANAVFDGSDALMLSAESAAGRFPKESVAMMARIIETAHSSHTLRGARPPENIAGVDAFQDLMSRASVLASQRLDARAIVVFTLKGTTARLISKYRPDIPIIAITPSEEIRRRMLIYWGVEPFAWGRSFGHLEECLPHVDKLLCDYHFAEPDDAIVIASERTLRLHRVGEPYFQELESPNP